MKELVFTVPDEWDGKKLDEFLRRLHRLSGTAIKSAKAIENGITMDGGHIRTVDAVRAGAAVRVVVDAEPRRYRPSGAAVGLLYLDGDIAVADKPANMPCHPSRGHPYDSLANALASRPELEGTVFRPIGRLDKDTTGAVVCALHAHSACFLTENRPEKLYLAIVSPPPKEDRRVIEAPIARESAGSPKRCVALNGRRALTRFCVLLKDDKAALLVLKIETGRTHQIRVHMSHTGSPLIGDALYGGDCSEFCRHALHCAAASFTSPCSGERISVLAPLPEDMLEYLAGRFGKGAADGLLDNIDLQW